MLYVWIGLFGLVGTFARFGLQNLVQRATGAGFPWGTFIVNITGSFLVGLIARYGSGSAAMSAELKVGLLVGLCGGYTTFSAFSLETVRLLQEGQWLRGAAYVLGSVVVSLAATAIGMRAAA